METFSFTNRPYQDARDLGAMINLVSKQPSDRVAAFPSIVDLEEISGTEEGRAAFHLWYKGENLLAFSYLIGDFFAFEVDTQAPYEYLVDQLFDWAQAQFAAAVEPPKSIFTSCREDDEKAIVQFQQHGFLEDPVRTIHFSRSLREPIPAPVLPEGFAIRPLRGEAELQSWLSVHYATHESSQMTADFRLSMMHAPEYHPELDLVAIASGGQLAAYAMCHFSTQENQLRKRNVGYTDPVATHPDFQGKGLARALLLEGFQLLKELGMHEVEVSTSGDNLGMIRTAESVGYRQSSATIFFGKSLE